MKTYPAALVSICVVGLSMACPSVAAGPGAGAGVDAIRGGRMYDKWWVVAEVAAPEVDHPLYPEIGSRTGSTTWRCKECHGWDYQGAAGAYAEGSSHFTGIGGILDTTLTATEIFDLLKFSDVKNGHGYGDAGLVDTDIDDLVEFVTGSLINTDNYIDENKIFLGNEMQGHHNYMMEGNPPCLSCHGPNGSWLNFSSPEDPEWVGTIAVQNPWEMMHKVRFGHPGSFMPSWIESGGTTQGVADIGRYCQLNFPEATCPGDANEPFDGIVNTNDLLAVLDNWGAAGGIGDANNDGLVSYQDLLLVIAGWGMCTE